MYQTYIELFILRNTIISLVNMAEIREFITGFVGAIIAIVVAISMLPVLTTTISTANLSGTEAVIVGLSTLLIAVGILMFIIKSFF